MSGLLRGLQDVTAMAERAAMGEWAALGEWAATALPHGRYGAVLVAILASYSAALVLPTRAAYAADADAERDPRAFLPGKLKILADSGRLRDPAYVAEVLELSFRDETIERSRGDCANPLLQKSDRLNRYIPTGDVWYKTLPGGEPHVKFPGFTINPPQDTIVTPELTYEIIATEDCSGGMSLFEETNARLHFTGLPAFACIQNVQDLLPKAVFQLGTDGYSQVSYEGRVDDSSGTGLSFGYRAFFSCALDASIGQSVRSGFRYERARRKYRDCLSTAKKSFCTSHQPFGWEDGKTQDAMLMDGIRQCGGLQHFYQKEPSTGKPPPERPPDLTKHATPCD